MADEYELHTDAYAMKAAKQFVNQTGADKGACMLTIGLVRTPLIQARLASLKARKLGRANNERQHAIDCAVRAFTHFNPQFGYCAEMPCLRCKRTITDNADISIVMLALPPWDGKTDTIKTAMMAGFFCAACDVLDVEANALWADTVKEQGLELIPATPGHA